jgi:hypothetical protein
MLVSTDDNSDGDPVPAIVRVNIRPDKGHAMGARTSKSVRTTIVRDGSACFIPVPFDPKPLFGRVRAPVKVTVNGYTYRTTIASMGDGPCVPLRKSHREAAGLDGGETLTVRFDLDTDRREVSPPADLLQALRNSPGAWDGWAALSYTHQREHAETIEQAKKPETRARRIASAISMIQQTNKKKT